MALKVEICLKKPLKKREMLLLSRSKSIYSRDIIIRNILGKPIPAGEHRDESKDIQILLEACEALSKCYLMCKDHNLSSPVYIHQSGTAMRLMTALLSCSEGSFILRGDPQVQKRPIAPLVDALKTLGADITYMDKEGHLPLLIRGRNLASHGTIDARGWESSQYVSALLLIAPKVKGGLRLLRSRQDGSTPYIDLTIEQMKRYGASVVWQGDLITVSDTPYRLPPQITDERDWSSAGYWYQLLALHPDLSELYLPGLFFTDSLQGDKTVAKLFEAFGIYTAESSGGVTLSKRIPTDPDQGEVPTIDLSHYPDLFPTLAVTYAMLGRSVHFVGLRSLAIKESNRLDTVLSGLRAMGFTDGLRYDSDTFSYDGTPRNPSSTPIIIDSHDDHRIAMSFAIAGATMPIGLTVEGAESVRKSYPAFWDELSKVATLRPHPIPSLP